MPQILVTTRKRCASQYPLRNGAEHYLLTSFRLYSNSLRQQPKRRRQKRLALLRQSTELVAGITAVQPARRRSVSTFLPTDDIADSHSCAGRSTAL